MLSDKNTSDTAEETQQFLQSAVHDLRAAQRRTGISAELLLQCANDAAGERERQELAAQILQGLAKTEELLTGIGRYAITLTPNRFAITEFPSASAVRFALLNLDRAIRESGATVTYADLPDIQGDRDRIVEVFEHLIGNSIKFRGSAVPAIEINAQTGDEGWRFSVKDNGVGIPLKYRNRLFIAFRRLQGAEIPGAGLGLAISKKIVEAHGGKIWIEDREAPGVTFSFLLPKTEGQVDGH